VTGEQAAYLQGKWDYRVGVTVNPWPPRSRAGEAWQRGQQVARVVAKARRLADQFGADATPPPTRRSKAVPPTTRHLGRDDVRPIINGAATGLQRGEHQGVTR
jgi:hypothetical protein